MAEKLGDKLWKALEEAQGQAFLSESVVEMTDAQALAQARRVLGWERRCVKILERFIKEHDGFGNG